MGIAFSFLEFFDLLYKQNSFHDPVVALGSLNINEPEEVIQEFAATNQWWKHDETYSVRSLFRDRYNILDYRDIDINGAADVWLDLNKPLETSSYNSVNVILNGGTLEHVFDIAQAFKNIHAMLRAGGVIIHLAPVSWYNHGYYNFNPLLFKGIAVANGYQMLAEGFYCSPGILAHVLQGASANYGGENGASEVFITFDGEYTEENERISDSFNKPTFPANLLYMVAYRKSAFGEFVYPVDCQS